MLVHIRTAVPMPKWGYQGVLLRTDISCRQGRMAPAPPSCRPMRACNLAMTVISMSAIAGGVICMQHISRWRTCRAALVATVHPSIRAKRSCASRV